MSEGRAHWFDPYTTSGWLLSRLVRRPILRLAVAIGERYMARHGPDAPTPRLILWLDWLQWKLTTKEHRRKTKWAPLSKCGIKINDGSAE
jgi:hypothetical protein